MQCVLKAGWIMAWKTSGLADSQAGRHNKKMNGQTRLMKKKASAQSAG
jgi:hypothetical protein